MLDDKIKSQLIRAQKNEITEHVIYNKLAEIEKDKNNKKALRKISEEELEHYRFWKKYTGKEVKPDSLNVLKYLLISRLFGITFGIKLMESGEKKAQVNYNAIAKKIQGAKAIEKDEEKHEQQLIKMIDEERLRYASSMVLGLNDALVELSGALAGLTFAIQNSQIIATTGLITGIAAALSMASSEYLSTKTEEADAKRGKNEKKKDPIKAATYTGAIYLITVFFLILPYLLISNLYMALAIMLAIVLIVIFVFTFYISVAKDLAFWKRFIETASVSFAIAGISFGIGAIVRTLWGIQI